MPTNKERLAFVDKQIEYFEGVPEEKIDQWRGVISGERYLCACFGAHVAKCFGIKAEHWAYDKPVYADFTGRKLWLEDFESNERVLLNYLQRHGAGKNAFGLYEWSATPLELLKSIRKGLTYANQ